MHNNLYDPFYETKDDMTFNIEHLTFKIICFQSDIEVRIFLIGFQISKKLNLSFCSLLASTVRVNLFSLELG